MSLPVFGPTGLQNVHDDAPVPYAVIRIDYRISREELFAAWVLAFTEQNPDRDPDLITVEQIRDEVENCLAANSFNEIWAVVESGEDGSYSGEQLRRLDALRRAMERAYPVGGGRD